MRIFDGASIYEVTNVTMVEKVIYTKKFFKENFEHTEEYTIEYKIIDDTFKYSVPYTVTKEVGQKMMKELFETGMLDLTKYGDIYSNPVNIIGGR
ncbi:MAG: hypothetical protein IJ583_03305 [Firmicutes bacterium]|nr:hypothetical protein [Bacillota bacterium]